MGNGHTSWAIEEPALRHIANPLPKVGLSATPLAHALTVINYAQVAKFSSISSRHHLGAVPFISGTWKERRLFSLPPAYSTVHSPGQAQFPRRSPSLYMTCTIHRRIMSMSFCSKSKAVWPSDSLPNAAHNLARQLLPARSSIGELCEDVARLSDATCTRPGKASPGTEHAAEDPAVISVGLLGHMHAVVHRIPRSPAFREGSPIALPHAACRMTRVASPTLPWPLHTGAHLSGTCRAWCRSAARPARRRTASPAKEDNGQRGRDAGNQCRPSR